MADVVSAISGAKNAILFLAFYPGSPNVAQWAAARQDRNKEAIRARLRHQPVGVRVVLLRAARGDAAHEGQG